MSRNRLLIYGVPFILLFFVFLFLKLEGTHTTELLYQQGQFDLLNFLANSTGEHSLDYYRGQIVDVSLGPLSVAIAGILFLSFALIYLKDVSPKRYGIAIFCFLLLSKFDTLFNPPYGDAIIAQMAEGLWLLKNNFDYFGLFRQPNVTHGGPVCYYITIYPTYIALLYLIFPNVKMFLLANHLITFTLITAIVSLFREILLSSFDKTRALLVSLLLLFTPLFLTHSELITMETPTLFFAIWSMNHLRQHRYGPGAFLAILSMLVKEVGMITCVAVFFVYVLDKAFDRKGRWLSKDLLWSLIALSMAILRLSVKYLFRLNIEHLGWIGPLYGFTQEGHRYQMKSAPVFYIYLFCMASLIFQLIKTKFSSGKGIKVIIQEFIQNHFTVVVMFVMAGMWVLFLINYGALIPRYQLLVFPFIIFLAFDTLNRWIASPKVLISGFLMAYLMTFVFSYGAVYKMLDKQRDSWIANNHKSHIFYERSLEYRGDLKLYQRIAQELEKNVRHLTFVVPNVLTQALAMPEYGYVTTGLRHLVIYGNRNTYAGVKNYNGLNELDLNKSIFIGYRDDLYPYQGYPIGDKDRPLGKIVYGQNEALLFMGGFEIEKTWRRYQLLKVMAYLKKEKEITAHE